MSTPEYRRILASRLRDPVDYDALYADALRAANELEDLADGQDAEGLEPRPIMDGKSVYSYLYHVKRWVLSAEVSRDGGITGSYSSTQLSKLYRTGKIVRRPVKATQETLSKYEYAHPDILGERAASAFKGNGK